jgi:hypothetical protein
MVAAKAGLITVSALVIQFGCRSAAFTSVA